MSNSQVKKKIVIVGLPSTGKSELLSILKLSCELSGYNYTLASEDNSRIRCIANEQCYEFCEYNIPPHQLDIAGAVTKSRFIGHSHFRAECEIRDMMFSENPDIVIQCISDDPRQFRQSLVLTSVIMYLDVQPIIFLTNTKDISKGKLWINSTKLAHLTDLPVFESIRIGGSEDFMQSLFKNSFIKHSSPFYIMGLDLRPIISRLPSDIRYKQMVALLMLMNDQKTIDYIRKTFDFGEEAVAQLLREVEIKKQLGWGLWHPIERFHRYWAKNIEKHILCTKQKPPNRFFQLVSKYMARFSDIFPWLVRITFGGIVLILSFIVLVFLMQKLYMFIFRTTW